MGGNLERRLSRLEVTQGAKERRQVVIWREVGQTAEQAIAAEFPLGVPDHVDPVIVSWQKTAE